MHRTTSLLLALPLLGACQSEDTGDLEIVVEPEDTIIEGLEAGDGVEDIRDGWSAQFERYLVVLGEVDLRPVTDPQANALDETLFAVDLATLPPSGLPLWSFDGLAAGDWTPFYAVHPANESTVRDSSVRRADFEAMQQEGWSYLIEGAITHPNGQSCPPANVAEPGDLADNGSENAAGDPCYDSGEVRFRLGVEVDVVYGPCGIDGQDGFNVPAGGRQTVAFTFHGDHLFFNGFPEGGEGGVRRQAQWLADSDLNLDGEVTRAELEALVPADLVALSGYDLDADIELDTMWDYVIAQLRSQGHFQGEGECAVDGESHDHD